MSNAQVSNSFAQTDNQLNQHGISQAINPAIAAAQPSIETTDIIELADKQLEAVAGGAGQRRRPEVV